MSHRSSETVSSSSLSLPLFLSYQPHLPLNDENQHFLNEVARLGKLQRGTPGIPDFDDARMTGGDEDVAMSQVADQLQLPAPATPTPGALLRDAPYRHRAVPMTHLHNNLDFMNPLMGFAISLQGPF